MQKILFISLLIGAAFSFSATAQPPVLTWPELKAIHEQDRDNLKTRQESELRFFAELQKKQMETFMQTAPSQDRTYELARGLSGERVDIARIHSDERKALAASQKTERESFMKNSPARVVAPQP